MELYDFQTKCVTKLTAQNADGTCAVPNGLIGDDFPLERFLSRLREEDRGYKTPCWIWTRALGGRGNYGVFSWAVRGKRFTRAAHVLMYELSKGPVPEGLEIDHLCKVRACCRHLEAVTRQVNMTRMRKALCGSGHELTEDNIYRHPKTDNIHGCKMCRREATRKCKRKGVVE